MLTEPHPPPPPADVWDEAEIGQDTAELAARAPCPAPVLRHSSITDSPVRRPPRDRSLQSWGTALTPPPRGALPRGPRPDLPDPPTSAGSCIPPGLGWFLRYLGFPLLFPWKPGVEN